MKRLLLLLCGLMLISVVLLTACKGSEKQNTSPAASEATPDTSNTEAMTGEPFSELDFEEEVTIPLGENEGVGGL